MPEIVHFEIPVDDAERAKKFYTKLLGWEVEQFSPGMEHWMINSQEGTGGGMMKRQHPDQKITDYFGVLSVQGSVDKSLS